MLSSKAKIIGLNESRKLSSTEFIEADRSLRAENQQREKLILAEGKEELDRRRNELAADDERLLT